MPPCLLARNDRAEASIIGTLIAFSLAVSLIPAGLSLRESVREEMRAHSDAARKAVEAAQAESAVTLAAVELARAEAERAKHEADAAKAQADLALAAASAARAEAARANAEASAARAALDLAVERASKAEANAQIAEAEAVLARFGAFCARNPEHPDCPMIDDEWIETFACTRTGPRTIVCNPR